MVSKRCLRVLKFKINIMLMVHVIHNNSFVWEKVPELDFTVIFKKVIFNEIWRKLVTNDGGVYLLLTNVCCLSKTDIKLLTSSLNWCKTKSRYLDNLFRDLMSKNCYFQHNSFKAKKYEEKVWKLLLRQNESSTKESPWRHLLNLGLVYFSNVHIYIILYKCICIYIFNQVEVE